MVFCQILYHVQCIQGPYCSLLIFFNREEESLVDVFIIEMLVVMVNSLKLAHKDAQSISKSQYHYYEIHTSTLGTMDQCSLSLDHMSRIIKTKSSTCLSKHNKNRRVPRGLKSADLSTLTVWLLAQCGSIETQARKVCRKLLIQLAPPSSREYTRISGSILT